MKRWNTKTGEYIENPLIDAFLAEIRDVCVRHGFSLSEDDVYGGFRVSRFQEGLMKNLEIATDNTDPDSRNR